MSVRASSTSDMPMQGSVRSQTRKLRTTQYEATSTMNRTVSQGDPFASDEEDPIFEDTGRHQVSTSLELTKSREQRSSDSSKFAHYSIVQGRPSGIGNPTIIEQNQPLKLPFASNLPFRFETGRSIVLEGYLSTRAQSLFIDLQTSKEGRPDGDCPMHFMMVVEDDKQTVGFKANSFLNGCWGDKAIATEGYPIKQESEEFTLTITVGKEDYYVFLNDYQVMKFAFRVHPSHVTYAKFDGDVDIRKVKFPLSLVTPYVGNIPDGLRVNKRVLILTALKTGLPQKLSCEISLSTTPDVHPSNVTQLRMKMVLERQHVPFVTCTLDFNHYIKGNWGKHFKTHSGLMDESAFQGTFSLCLLPTNDGFQFFINDRPISSYSCKLALERLNYLTFISNESTLELHKIEFKATGKENIGCWAAFTRRFK